LFIGQVLTYLLYKQLDYKALPTFHFAGVWEEVFDVLSSHVSTTDLIHTLAQPAVSWLCIHSGNQVSDQHLRLLQSYTPIIFRVVRNHDNTWPSYAVALLLDLSNTCRAPFELCDAPVPKIEELPDLNYPQTGHW
jgi:hypothetical protein